MKSILLIFSLFVFSSPSFATGNFNNDTGTLVIRNLSVDGTTTYDSVRLQLNLANGTFTILDSAIKEIDRRDTFSKTPIDTFTSDNTRIDFMGCIPTAYDAELRKRQIVCRTQVTSLNGDEVIRAIGNQPHELIDNQGNIYNRQLSVMVLDELSPVGNITFNAIQGIPVSVIHVFSDVDSADISTFKPTFHIENTVFNLNPIFQVNIPIR